MLEGTERGATFKGFRQAEAGLQEAHLLPRMWVSRVQDQEEALSHHLVYTAAAHADQDTGAHPTRKSKFL